MENSTGKITISIQAGLISQVFTFMGSALVISGVVSYVFANNPALLNLLYPETGGISILGYVVMFSPIIFTLIMSRGFEKMSAQTLILMLILFSAFMGASLSSLFLIYSSGTLATTFFVSAGTFLTMAIVGYTTKTDLTKMGKLLYMGLIGIIFASVINWFIGSAGMDYLISIIGVLVFTGLTAYDMQRLKNLSYEMQGGELQTKAAVMGALSMYLNFVNLFLFLLRFFGGNRD